MLFVLLTFPQPHYWYYSCSTIVYTATSVALIGLLTPRLFTLLYQQEHGRKMLSTHPWVMTLLTSSLTFGDYWNGELSGVSGGGFAVI